MVDKTVKLSRRYEVPGHEPFDTVTLREPTYADRYMSGLGAPYDWQPDGKGGSLLLVYPSVVDAYLQRLIKAPEYSAISGISAADGGELEAALFSFFGSAQTQTASPMGSSSDSAGVSPT